uniref:Uncharacterized protein n=1 Tax=Spongospora subterranea TaxID=70186 RepID=A0A0H5QHY4_9EUKA|eukprot:CRZ00926.1 hypothetical protein [Spongospora subterranea]
MFSFAPRLHHSCSSLEIFWAEALLHVIGCVDRCVRRFWIRVGGSHGHAGAVAGFASDVHGGVHCQQSPPNSHEFPACFLKYCDLGTIIVLTQHLRFGFKTTAIVKSFFHVAGLVCSILLLVTLQHS